MKKKEHHLQGDTKMDALTQTPGQDQNMFSQPLPQENNPLMGETPQEVSTPASSQVMNDIVSPGVSSPSAPVSDFSPAQPDVTVSPAPVETPAEGTVAPVSVEQEVPVQESPAEKLVADTTPESVSSTPDFPSVNPEPVSQMEEPSEVQPPVVESPTVTQPEPALDENITPSLDDVPLPPTETTNLKPEEPMATDMGTVQSVETAQDVPQRQSSATEGVQIPVNQPVESQMPENPVTPQEQETVVPVVEEAPASIPTDGAEEAGKSSTMADLSRGLNISQPTTDQTGEGNPEPPVQDI